MAEVIGFRPDGMPSRLSRRQVVNWIAFRRTDDVDLVKKMQAEIAGKWGHELGNHPDGYSVLRALHALVGGPPLYPIPKYPENYPVELRRSEPPPEFERLKVEVDKLVSDRGKPVSELISELEAELDVLGGLSDAIDLAKGELREAEDDGRLSLLERSPHALFRGVDVVAIWPTTVKSPQRRRTGVAGRPSSKDLAIREMERRSKLGEMLPKVAPEARELVAWLAVQHPDEPCPTAPSLENSIRDRHRQLLNPMK